jgi:hypothetical protein
MNRRQGVERSSFDKFNSMLPRTISSESTYVREDKQGNLLDGLGNNAIFGSAGSPGAGNILRSPSRRFYDPAVNATSIFLPQSTKEINRWNRYFYAHDEIVGAVIDIHSELPYSKAEFLVDDPIIKKHIEECVDKTNFFTSINKIDHEYIKMGEVFPYTHWDSDKGMWDNITILNPDYIDISYSPFVNSDGCIELIPDDQLKKLIFSTKPEDQQLKKKLDKELVRRVITGRNIILDPSEITHIARRNNPYDMRGKSIIERLWRLLIYEDKLREAQLTIADNFIYPLKIFKLGDRNIGWIPDQDHQRALAQMLQQANFDPNFALIYHYGLEVDYVTVADKVMRLDPEWNEINKKKMMALGVSENFLTGESTYASMNAGMQIQLARYKAKRDMMEELFIKDKFFRIMAERNGWYKRDKIEINAGIRIGRTKQELEERLIIPKLIWHKKLMLRDDQSYLNFLNNVYAAGNGPISAITLLMAMGLDLEEELTAKKKQKTLEERIGEFIHLPKTAAQGVLKKFGFNKSKDNVFSNKKEAEKDSTFVGEESEININLGVEDVMANEKSADIGIMQDIDLVDDSIWYKNIQSINIPSEVVLDLTSLIKKVRNAQKKFESVKNGLVFEKNDIENIYTSLYTKGKLFSYNYTNFLPIYKQHYASSESLTDYTDIVMINQFNDWIDIISKENTNDEILARHLRNFGNTVFCYGQLKGFKEQGINVVKVSNVPAHDGFQYKVNDLLKKDWNLSSLISPNSEIVLFYPCLEGYEDEEYGNNIDPHISKNLDINIENFVVKNCPIEYISFVENFIKKTGKVLKKKYEKISFVKDVIDLQEYEDMLKQQFKKAGITDDIDLSTRIMYDKMAKRNQVPVLNYNKILYISTWLGKEECLISDTLLKYSEFNLESIEKEFNKTIKEANYDLTSDELSTYNLLGYIEPMTDDKDEKQGWRIKDAFINDQTMDEKLIVGKIWNLNGKCAYKIKKQSNQLFTEQLKNWINYPHKLNKDVKQFFEEVF